MRAVDKRLRSLGAAVIIVAAALGGAAIECSGASSAAPSDDGGLVNDGASFDAGADAADDHPAALGNCELATVIPGCPTSAPDGGAFSDWPGWERLPGLEPCCVVDRPVANGAAGPPATWIPCPDEDGGCLQLTNPADPGQGPFIHTARVSHDSSGRANYLQVRWALSQDARLVQDTIFDLTSGGRVASAIRTDAETCAALLDVSSNRAALIIHNDAYGTEDGGSANLIVVRGDPNTLLDRPTFECVANDRGPLTVLQEHSISDTTVGFSTTDYRVYRSGVDGGRWTETPPGGTTGVRGLLLDFVAKDDPYATTSALGFIREYTVLPDGTPVLYRAKPDRDVTAFATDDTTMFWTESPKLDPQSNPIPHEVWAASYTSDPTALDATARKIAALSSIPRTLRSVASNGLYAVALSVTQNAVVRLSDGAVRLLGVTSRNTRLMYGWLVHVSPTELWVVVATDGNGGGMYVRRYDLGSW